MHVRHSASTHKQAALQIGSPAAIFYRPVTGLAAAADQTPAKKLANQLRYNLGGSGTFYGYAGVGYGGTVRANITDYTPSLFVVPADTPLQKVAYVKPYSKGDFWPEGTNAGLQRALEAVPLPVLSSVPSGRLTMNEAENLDAEITIWQPSTGRLWELAEVDQTVEGGKTQPFVPPAGYGASCGYYGGYMTNVGQWNGIWNHPEWGSRATGLMMAAGVISLQDLVEVLEGKKIKHAIGIEVQVEAAEVCPPAIRHDTVVATNTLKEHEGEPNPAYGAVDAVPLGQWVRFPAASNASEHFNHATEPLGWAIYEAGREYGFVVTDSSSAPAFQIEPPIAMGSPYAFNAINPLTGAEGEGWPSKKQLEYVPSGMTDASLGHFAESIHGPSSCFTKQPWLELEALGRRES